MKPKGGLLIEFGAGKGGPPASEKMSAAAPVGPESEMDEMGDMDAEFEDAAQTAFDAIQEGDVEGFKAALRAAVECCG